MILHNARKYLQVYKTKIQDTLEYRFDFLFGTFTHFLPLGAVLVLWSAVYREKSEIAGYSYAAMLSYFIVARAVQGMLYVSMYDQVEKDIKDGLLSKYLLKPISYLGYWLSVVWAEKSVHIFADFFFFGLIAWFCRHSFFVQTDPAVLLLFAVSLLFGFLINFFISFVVSLSAFWMQEIWSVSFTKDMLHEFLSGGAFILDLMPLGLYKVMLCLPFAYCLYFPLQIYLGRCQGWAILRGFGMQILFIFGTWLLAAGVWRLGIKKYESIGA